jgi:hypothetical protein
MDGLPWTMRAIERDHGRRQELWRAINALNSGAYGRSRIVADFSGNLLRWRQVRPWSDTIPAMLSKGSSSAAQIGGAFCQLRQ